MAHASSWLHRLIAALLLVWALLLNARFVTSAGPLWRDEANSVAQASLPDWGDVWSSLQYDSFPILYPSVLRLWVSYPPLAGDRSLRVLGFCIGVGVLLSLWLTSRALNSSEPVVVLALLAIDPIVVSEACSIRPYGLSLILLLWAYHAQWSCLNRPSASRILGCTILSVLSVQTSYNNAIFIGVFVFSAAAISLARGESRKALWVLVPGVCAALSLLPYWKVLKRAQGWVALLHYRVSWMEFFQAYTEAQTIAYPLIWASVSILAALCLYARFRQPATEAAPSPALSYALTAAATGLACQVIFIQWIRIPPFPRYLLPVLVLAGFALQLAVGKKRWGFQVLLIIGIVLAPCCHAWSFLGLRRTNADHVAVSLSKCARTSDLVVLSPWFLHPSFQRYYQGSAYWVTVPPLPHSPITRYDLFRSTMLARDPSAAIAEALSATLLSGGRIWFVHQAVGRIPSEGTAPEVPVLGDSPDGYDYVRFRSYWERDIWHRLRACCYPQGIVLPITERVWKEERLLLTLFQRH